MRFGTVTKMVFTKPMHSHPLGAAAASGHSSWPVAPAQPHKSTDRASAYVGMGMRDTTHRKKLGEDSFLGIVLFSGKRNFSSDQMFYLV